MEPIDHFVADVEASGEDKKHEAFEPVLDDISEGEMAAAIRTLRGMGYYWNGGEQWRPTVGKKPDFEQIDALCDAYAAEAVKQERERTGWQPIETAPRDGSEILLGRAESEELDSPGISVPGYWQKGYEDGVDYMGCDSGFVDSHHQTFGGGRSFGAESHRYAPNQPTHWQPLPAPPKDQP